MRTRRDRNRLLLGLAVSLLVHGLLLWPSADRPPAMPPSPPTTIELEILHEPSVQSEDAPVETEEPEAVALTELPSGGEAAREAPAPRAPRELPPAIREEPTEPTGAAPAEGPVVRREEDGVWKEEALPRLDLVYRPKIETEEAPEGEPGEAPVSEGAEIEDRLQAYFRDKRAEEHARSRMEPEIAELRQRLEQRFTVPMEVLDEVPSNPTLGLADSLRAYGKQAQRYGATGNPYGDELLAPGAPEALDTVGSTTFRYQHADATKGPPVSFTSATVTTLVARIEVARGAEEIEVRILESSGVPRFDELALEHVRRELLRLRLPNGVERMRWAFVSTLRVTPPGPVVGCSIDQAFIPQECFYPGSKHQRSRVYLEALYAD